MNIENEKIKYLYGEQYTVVDKEKIVELVSCEGVKQITEVYEVVKSPPNTYGLVHARELFETKSYGIKIVKSIERVNSRVELGLERLIGKPIVFEFNGNPQKFKTIKAIKVRPRDILYEIARLDGEYISELEIKQLKNKKIIIIKNGM